MKWEKLIFKIQVDALELGSGKISSEGFSGDLPNTKRYEKDFKALVSKEISEIIGKDVDTGESTTLAEGISYHTNGVGLIINKLKEEQRKKAKKKGWDID